jgi:hypothetical protein
MECTECAGLHAAPHSGQITHESACNGSPSSGCRHDGHRCISSTVTLSSREPFASHRPLYHVPSASSAAIAPTRYRGLHVKGFVTQDPPERHPEKPRKAQPRDLPARERRLHARIARVDPRQETFERPRCARPVHRAIAHREGAHCAPDRQGTGEATEPRAECITPSRRPVTYAGPDASENHMLTNDILRSQVPVRPRV